jgi:hypothetical protein
VLLLRCAQGGLFRARVYHNKECTLSEVQFATPEEARYRKRLPYLPYVLTHRLL